ncbi:MAG: histidine phosphatase family protein [Candidatus Micrarchaeota archaeon]
MLKRLMLLRHAEAESNDARFFAGWKDVPLTKLGIEQAEALEKRLSHERFDHVFCSDLGRAKETLRLSGVEAPTEYAPALREKNYGELEGVSWDGTDDYDRYHLDPFVRSPGGESSLDVQRRVVNYFHTHVVNQGYGSVLIVSHHGPIVLLACHLLGMPLEKWRTLRMGNAGLSIFSQDERMMRLTLWNSLSNFGMMTNRPLKKR